MASPKKSSGRTRSATSSEAEPEIIEEFVIADEAPQDHGGQGGNGGNGSLIPSFFTPEAPSTNHGGPTPSYPILTEELGYPPSPLSSGGGGSGGSGSSDRIGSLGPTVTKALQAVLGWKINTSDADGFSGALSQSFSLKMVEGSVVSTWTPRSYAVQTDLAGGVSGAQASIYTMAKTLLDHMLPLLAGLYPLDPGSDSETVAALKSLITDQLNNLTTEVGNVGGPRVMRVHQYFQMLLGIRVQLRMQSTPVALIPEPVRHLPLGSPLRRHFDQPQGPRWPPSHYWKDPDTVLGSLGDLRDQLGLFESIGPRFVNTVADEQNVTNFRILIDYTNSLLGAWSNSIQFFASITSPFLGTQLVIISRQLSVISETVDEVRFVLDSVFVGPAQRASLPLDFSVLAASPTQTQALPVITKLPPIYLEDLLNWIQNFVGAEAQDVIQNGGKLGLGEDFKVMIAELYTQAVGLYLLSQQPSPPAGAMGTTRVQQSLFKLAIQLGQLYTASASVGVPYIPPRH